MHGVSTRSIDDLVKALGADSGISESEVSRICGELDAELTGFKCHSGLGAAIRTVFLDAAWQRCRVHFVRDVFSVIESGSGEMVAATIRTIFAQTTGEQVRTQLNVVADMLGRQFPQVKAILLDAATDITAFADFPPAHRKKIWSTNPLERLNREIKRRADVVQVFPNLAALDRLAAAVLAELHDEWQVFDRRYLSEGSMAEIFTTKPTETEPQITPQPEPKQLP